MSNKIVNIDKVISEFSKANLDEQIEAYHKLKDWLNDKISEKTTSLENEKERYLSSKESL